MKNLSDNFILYLSSMIPSCVSVIGSSLMIIGSLKLEERNSITLLIVSLGVCNFFVSLASIFPSYQYDEYFCSLQGFMHIFFQNLGCNVHALIAYALYKSFSTDSKKLKIHSFALLGAAIVLNLPLAIYPLTDNSFSYAGGWCTVDDKGEKSENIYFWFYTGMRYFPVWASIFYVMYAYYLILNKYRRLTMNFVQNNPESISIHSRTIMFPLALIITYFPITFERCYAQAYKVNLWVEVCCIIINSFVGVINCFVYSIGNSNLKHKITGLIWKKVTFHERLNFSSFEESAIK